MSPPKLLQIRNRRRRLPRPLLFGEGEKRVHYSHPPGRKREGRTEDGEEFTEENARPKVREGSQSHTRNKHQYHRERMSHSDPVVSPGPTFGPEGSWRSGTTVHSKRMEGRGKETPARPNSLFPPSVSGDYGRRKHRVGLGLRSWRTKCGGGRL